jgi:HD-GYP domain-containing protein (c-di-GMP phosphodiesterase class II)
VDTFSAIIEGRVYQPKRHVQEAIDTLLQESGKRLDGTVVDALIQMIRERAFIV